MKVKDFISQLEKLDKDSNIYILYDGLYILEPDIDVATEDDVDVLGENNSMLEVGDYLMRA